jgi:hypothetical protein
MVKSVPYHLLAYFMIEYISHLKMCIDLPTNPMLKRVHFWRPHPLIFNSQLHDKNCDDDCHVRFGTCLYLLTRLLCIFFFFLQETSPSLCVLPKRKQEQK